MPNRYPQKRRKTAPSPEARAAEPNRRAFAPPSDATPTEKRDPAAVAAGTHDSLRYAADPALRRHLDAFEVDVPDFPMRRSWPERVSAFWFRPAANPLERAVVSFAALTALYVAPLVVCAVGGALLVTLT